MRRRLAQGHHDTQLGGAGDPTSNLAVTSQPALPPVLMPPSFKRSYTLDYIAMLYSGSPIHAAHCPAVCVCDYDVRSRLRAGLLKRLT